jgi:hypothetical protein
MLLPLLVDMLHKPHKLDVLLGVIQQQRVLKMLLLLMIEPWHLVIGHLQLVG